MSSNSYFDTQSPMLRRNAPLWRTNCIWPYEVMYGNDVYDEAGNYSLIITVFFHDYGGLAWEIGLEVSDENALEYCDHDATITRVPRSLPFASDRYTFERKAYEDFLELLLNPVATELTATEAPQSNTSGQPVLDFEELVCRCQLVRATPTSTCGVHHFGGET
jgi:hypothetical protein